MNKEKRNFVLEVEGDDGIVRTIVPPLTLEFDINRKLFGKLNEMTLRIFNLNEDSRNSLRKDFYDIQDIRKISLRAGYGENMPLISTGNIKQAWSIREGNNFITTIKSFDAGWANSSSTFNKEYPKGTKTSSIINDMVDSTKPFGLAKGAVSVEDVTLPRGNSYSGSTIEQLQELTGGDAFVDNGVLNVLKQDEALDIPIFKITSRSGLLGTPVRERTLLDINMIFEPSIQLGGLVELESTTYPGIDGLHKVIGVDHRALISDSAGGSATTRLTLIDGTFKLVKKAIG